MNSPTEYSFKSFKADRTGLDCTMLYYPAVCQAMMSVQRPVHSKITVYNLHTRLANWLQHTTEDGFQGTIKHQGSPFLGFAQAFSVFIAW